MFLSNICSFRCKFLVSHLSELSSLKTRTLSVSLSLSLMLFKSLFLSFPLSLYLFIRLFIAFLVNYGVMYILFAKSLCWPETKFLHTAEFEFTFGIFDLSKFEKFLVQKIFNSIEYLICSKYTLLLARAKLGDTMTCGLVHSS